jgi:hypothetical protein
MNRRPRYEHAKSVELGATYCRLTSEGRRGFLGIGRAPNKYEVRVHQQTVVQLTYKQKARIRATIGSKPDPTEDIEQAKSRLLVLLSRCTVAGSNEAAWFLEAAQRLSYDCLVFLSVLIWVATYCGESEADNKNCKNLIAAIAALDRRVFDDNPPKESIFAQVGHLEALVEPMVVTQYIGDRSRNTTEMLRKNSMR